MRENSFIVGCMYVRVKLINYNKEDYIDFL